MARNSRGRVARSTRKSLWLQFIPITTTITGATATVMFSLNAAALALRPFTLIRSHFEILIRSDQSAAVEQQICAIGCAIVSDQASAVGVTAVPTPETEAGSSLWFLHKFMMAQESSVTDKAQPAGQFSIDSKAMRKVEVGSDLVVVVENSALLTGGTVFVVGGRILVKTN